MLRRSPADTFAEKYNKLLANLPPPWMAAAETAASETAASRPPSITVSRVPAPDDSTLLLTLACMLADHEFSLDILSRGAAPRERWTEQGEVGEMAASYAGLADDLCSFLSDPSRLRRAVDELERASTFARTSDNVYTLDASVRARVLAELAPDVACFWRQQALIVTYRSIPWKYLESAYVLDLVVIFVYRAHLLQALRADRAACAAP